MTSYTAVCIVALYFLGMAGLPSERGASAAGWLAVEEGPIEPGRCVVRLAPWNPGGADPAVAAATEQKAHETAVGRDGFFQLKGIPAGVYVLEARQPGFSPARVAPLRVGFQAETFLEEPIVLRRPLELAIEVAPPLDWLGHPWRARVVREEESGGRPNPVVFEGAVGKSGILRVPDQGRPWPGTLSGPMALRIPALAPGAYRICLVPLRVQNEPPASSATACDSGTLFAGSTLVLQIGKE